MRFGRRCASPCFYTTPFHNLSGVREKCLHVRISSLQVIGISRDFPHGKNGFVTATKLGTTNDFFVASTANFAAATKRFVDRTKHFVITKYFCYPN